ncbi:MAG: hypothetical protein HY951_15010 [Bacteroidia bacterium]|nr:hypothetical protein [Bacteroidia bacterium]
MKKELLVLLAAIILLSGCNKWGYVSLKYPTPPAVYLPENIKNIAIVNRSLIKKGDRNNQVVESIVTGEIAGPDKLASEECLKGVVERLNGWRNISVVPVTRKFYGNGTRDLPPLMDWNMVKHICDSTKTDALLVLENFDSNSDIVLTTVTNSVNAVISAATNVPTPTKQIKMNIISNWRMYDPSSKTVVDQYQTIANLVLDATGPSFNLPPMDALPKSAYAAGEEYIQRFLPGYYFVRRDMYKRGKGSAKQQFLAAFRKSEVANWSGAAEIWTELTKTTKRKNAGRACVNMAVSCEVLGKTDLALMWAKKAYEDYGNKIGRDYANQLKYRRDME